MEIVLFFFDDLEHYCKEKQTILMPMVPEPQVRMVICKSRAENKQTNPTPQVITGVSPLSKV